MEYSTIVDLILKYGYPIVFVLVLIEGPLVTIISSFFSAAGLFNIFILYIIIVFADVFADIIWYTVGYYGREKIINRWGRFLGVTPEKLEDFEKLNNKFKNHQGKVLFIAKLTHVIGFPFLITAGIFKWNIKKFIMFNFLATIPKTLIFLLLGYFFGQASVIINKYLEFGTYLGIGVFILAILSYFMMIRFSRRLIKRFED